MQRNEPGKIFIGGLTWNTDSDALKEYFCSFGEVIDCIVMKNPQTGKSRGFGFVTFKDPSVLDVVLHEKHRIDGKMVDAKHCNAKTQGGPGGRGGFQGGRGGPGRGGGGGHFQRDFYGGGDHGGGPGDMPMKTNKIFAGGIPNEANEDTLKNYFGMFGTVTDVNIMYDQEKGRSRGFAFVTFEQEESVERVCHDRFHFVDGKKVECKRAEPRQGRNGGGQGRGRGGGPPMIGGPPGQGPPQYAPPPGPDSWGQGGNSFPPQGPPPGGPPGFGANGQGFGGSGPYQQPGGYQQPGSGFQQPGYQQPPYQGQQGGYGALPPAGGFQQAAPGPGATQSPSPGAAPAATPPYSQWAVPPPGQQPLPQQPPPQVPPQQPPTSQPPVPAPGYTGYSPQTPAVPYGGVPTSPTQTQPSRQPPTGVPPAAQAYPDFSQTAQQPPVAATQSYQGYGTAYANGQVQAQATSPGVAADPYAQQATPQAPVMGQYAQDPSSYGPSRTYTQPAPAAAPVGAPAGAVYGQTTAYAQPTAQAATAYSDPSAYAASAVAAQQPAYGSPPDPQQAVYTGYTAQRQAPGSAQAYHPYRR